MNKTNKIILTIVLALVIIALVAIMIWGIFGFGAGLVSARNPGADAANGKVFNISCGGMQTMLGVSALPRDAEQGTDYEVPVSQINSVDLDFIHENIQVAVWGNDAVRVEQRGGNLSGAYLMRYGVKDGKLIVESGLIGRANTWVYPPGYPSSTVTLYVPADLGMDVTLDTASGNVSVTDGAYGGLKVDTASGNVVLESVTANSLRIGAASGNVTGSGIQSGRTRVNTASGNVVLDGDAGSKLDVDTASGIARFTGSAGSVSVDTASGEVRLAVSGMEELDVDTASGNVYVEGADAAALREIDIDTVSGEVALTLPRDAGFQVEYDSIAGQLNSDFPINFSRYGDGQTKISVNTVSGSLNIRQG